MNDNVLPEKAIRQQISSAVHLIVQVSRLMDGSRKTTHITEIVGMEGDIITMQDIFKFEQVGLDENGKVIGAHIATGVRPRFADICKAKGVDLPTDIFTKQSAQEILELGDDKKPGAEAKPAASEPQQRAGAPPAAGEGSIESQNLRDLLRKRGRA